MWLRAAWKWPCEILSEQSREKSYACQRQIAYVHCGVLTPVVPIDHYCLVCGLADGATVEMERTASDLAQI